MALSACSMAMAQVLSNFNAFLGHIAIAGEMDLKVGTR